MVMEPPASVFKLWASLCWLNVLIAPCEDALQKNYGRSILWIYTTKYPTAAIHSSLMPMVTA
jgi:hypothetical protein